MLDAMNIKSRRDGAAMLEKVRQQWGGQRDLWVFGYASLIWSVVFGFLVFGETPDWGTVIGGLTIALAGVCLVLIEARAAPGR